MVIQQKCALQALEKIHREKYGGGANTTQFEDEVVPPIMRRSIAVYEAARCLIGYMTPFYDEISKVRCQSHCMTHLLSGAVINKVGPLLCHPSTV